MRVLLLAPPCFWGIAQVLSAAWSKQLFCGSGAGAVGAETVYKTVPLRASLLRAISHGAVACSFTAGTAACAACMLLAALLLAGCFGLLVGCL